MLFIIYRGERRERVGTISLQGDKAFGLEVPSPLVRSAMGVRDERSACGAILDLPTQFGDDAGVWEIEAPNKFS